MQIAVVTAVRPETRAVLGALSDVRRVRGNVGPSWHGRAGTASVQLLQSGVGLASAHAAATRLRPLPDLIVSVGFAGALRRNVEVGTLVLSAHVLWEAASGPAAYDVPPRLLDALRRASERPTIEGPLFSSPVVLATTELKAAAGERHGAAAVEMEGAALAAHAIRRGVPFLPVRVVLDPMELSLADLPEGIGTSWVARARLAVTPGLWPKVRVMHAHAMRATDVLGRVSARLLPALARPD